VLETEYDGPPLVQVTKQNECFVLESGLSSKLRATEERTWLILRMLRVPGNHRGYRLAEGDILRFGRAVLRVKELKVSGTEDLHKGIVPSSRLMDGHLVTDPQSEYVTDTGTVTTLPESECEGFGMFQTDCQCRVCYRDSYTIEDPLVSICKCAGSLKFVHINCVKNWIASRMQTREKGPVRTYEWKKLECEICRSEYPVKVTYEALTYDLLSVPKLHSRYLVLEELSRSTDSTYTCFYIHLEEGRVRCGRSHDCQVRVKDISVSRSHATLHLSQDAVYIEDNESKFGTLALVSRPIAMQSRTEVALQVGKTVLVFKIRTAWSLWDCFRTCRRPPSPDIEFEAEMSKPLSLSVDLE
jgi:hypothetical protein